MAQHCVGSQLDISRAPGRFFCNKWSLTQEPLGFSDNVSQSDKNHITFGHLLKTVQTVSGKKKKIGLKKESGLICLQSERRLRLGS